MQFCKPILCCSYNINLFLMYLSATHTSCSKMYFLYSCCIKTTKKNIFKTINYIILSMLCIK